MNALTEPAEPLTLRLSADERALIRGLVIHALGETRIEAHRTHTPDYRREVLRREGLLRDLIARLEGMAP
jgi:hypothetical protein